MSRPDESLRSSCWCYRWTTVVPAVAIVLSCILPSAQPAKAQRHSEKKTQIVIKTVDCNFPISRLQRRNETWDGTIKGLQDDRQKLRAKLKNAVPDNCRRRLPKGSQEARDCEVTVQSNIQKLLPDVTDFNSRVTGFCNSVIAALSGPILPEKHDGNIDTKGFKGKEKGRLAYLADVPPPVIERKETLEEWLRRNWSEAPEPLRSLLSQALNNPAAMKELIYRRPTEIGDWYRDATKESFSKKLARELTNPESRLRLAVQTWFDDPTHRQWLGDAATIALAPFYAEAFMGALTTGQSAVVQYEKSAFVEKFQEVQPWRQDLNNALRHMHEARASGTHYNFPTIYRGKEPNIPKWLFNENPYTHVFTGKPNWEGTANAAFMDAENVWIPRTLESDKALQASDMDFWRAITSQGN